MKEEPPERRLSVKLPINTHPGDIILRDGNVYAVETTQRAEDGRGVRAVIVLVQPKEPMG